MGAFARFARDERGVDLLEYALLATFMALALVTTLTSFTDSIGTFFNTLLD